MTNYLTIDERGVIRRFRAPDVDTVRAWAGRNGFVFTSIETVPSPGRWDRFEHLESATDVWERPLLIIDGKHVTSDETTAN